MSASKLAVSVALCAAVAAARTSDFAAVRKAAEVDAAKALALADTIVNPLERAQARVWLEYDARDFRAAYEDATSALSSVGPDAWLAERATAAALALGDAQRAREALARFENALASAIATVDANARGEWERARDAHRARVAELEVVERAGSRALTLARSTVALVVGASAAIWALLARAARPPRER